MNISTTTGAGSTIMRMGALMVFVLVAGVLQTTQAQRRVVIESGDYGVLNQMIEGDTLANGDRVDPNTVYVLKRDMTYWLEGSLQNPGYHLRLEAEEGAGHPPIMRPGVDITGEAQRLFVIRGDLDIDGIYVSNLDDFGAKQQQLFRVTGDSVRLRVNNVWMEWDQQAFFSLQTKGNDIYVTNSFGRNLGLETSTGNGRIFDTRSNDQDSIVVTNSTFYAIVNRPMLANRVQVNYIKWDHNTMVDMGQFWNAARVLEQHITNNLWVNPHYWGAGAPDPGREVAGFFRIDTLGTLPSGFSDEDRILVYRNNFFYRDPELVQINEDSGRVEIAMLDSTQRSWLEMGKAVVWENNVDWTEHAAEDQYSFADRPELPLDFRRAYLINPDDPNIPGFQDHFDDRMETSLDQWRDFTYPTTISAYTAADDGFPLGDLNWFPDKKAEWESGTQTDDEDAAELPDNFRLIGNYPNPFNPATNIVYELDTPAEVVLTVYNLLGQEVAKLDLGNQIAGRHEMSFEAGQLSSGLYLVKMKAGDQVQSIRMVLTK